MKCPPLLSAVQQFFSRNNLNKSTTGSSYKALGNDAQEENVFHDAIYKKLEGIDASSKAARARVAQAAKVLKKKLQPRGKKITVPDDNGLPISGYRTELRGVVKKASSNKFQLSLPGNRTVTRTREEIETHILLQSHLQEVHGDMTVIEGQVITMDDLDASSRCPLWFAPNFSAAKRPICDENAPLLNDTRPASPTHSIENEQSPRAKSRARPTSAHSAQTDNLNATGASPLQSPRNTPAVMPTSSKSGVSYADCVAKQQEMIQFIEHRFDLSPLAFFEAVSRKDPEVAGYLATQLGLLREQVGPELTTMPGYARSAVPGILVRCRGHGEEREGRQIRYEDNTQHQNSRVESNSEVFLKQMLLDRLKAEIDRQNRIAGSTLDSAKLAGSGIFPLGVATAVGAGNTYAPSKIAALPKERRLEALASTLENLPSNKVETSNALRSPQFCANHPEAAAFFGFVEELLILSKGDGGEGAERYNYIDDVGAANRKARSNKDSNGIAWAETFINGVERKATANSRSPVTWRVRIGNEWQSGLTTSEVMMHVFHEAVGHLHADKVDHASVKPLPLVAYEMLAHATGTTIPQHLIDHEANALGKVKQNQQQGEIRKQNNEEKCRISSDQKKEELEHQQQLCRKYGVQKYSHVFLCDNGLKQQAVVKPAIDCTFTFAEIGGNPLDTVRTIQDSLKHSHLRQSVSHQAKNSRFHDNLCWLRSSWISLFASAKPEALCERSHAMMDDGQASLTTFNLPTILPAIAKQFCNDPQGFLMPDSQRQSWSTSMDKSAHLGGNLPLSTIGPVESLAYRQKQSVENYLKDIQLAVAAEFRKETPGVMNEVEALSNFNSFGSSDMPVMLHRAFGVPVMVIETGVPVVLADGTHSTLSQKIRISAPKNSALAAYIEEEANNSTELEAGSAVMDQLLNTFKDLPVIWLERDHYSVYVPNVAIKN